MIRILRIIEYTYPDNKTAEEDMSKWHLGAIATLSPGKGKIIRSTVLTDLNFDSTVFDTINYDPTNPCLVRSKDGKVYGCATHWNLHGIGECIVQFFDGSADSMTFNELDFVHGATSARRALDARER